MSPTQSKRATRTSGVLFSAVGAIIAFLHNSSALAAGDVKPGYGSWSLPPNHSTHGGAMDTLFWWIFWITMVAWIGVTLALVYFLIKYRYRPDRAKGIFTHGNTRLEMTWTIAPAIILAVLAIVSKFIWDDYRYSPTATDPDRAIVLVIGQQFKWNVIYPGADKKLGKYMLFPKPTDLAWPNPDGSGKPYKFANVTGPAFLPYKEAISAINRYIDSVNPLGKDYTDPAGKDDDYKAALARELVLPKDRPIEVQLGSKDVIHSFYLPNFRVKLDAVPGMRGHLYFTSTMSSKEREAQSEQDYSIDQLLETVKNPDFNDLTVRITEKSEGAEQDAATKQYLYRDAEKKTIVRDSRVLTPLVADKLKAAGIKQVRAYQPGSWDLVCAELCGQGHSTMQGKLTIVDNAEYVKRFEPPPKPTTPGVAMNEVK